MKTKSTLLTMCAVVLIALATTACAEQRAQSSDPNAFAKETYSYSKSNNYESKPSEESSSEALAINGDVMWGMGKTFDEVSEKYGDITAGAIDVYMFENGYGKYVFDDSCNTIGEVPAKDFLVGDLSTVTLDNIAERCGFNVVPLNPTPDGQTMYDGYRAAYYTHPDYPNTSFELFYNENGFDETASFKVTLDSEIPAITDDFINTLNSVIDTAADVDALNSGIRNADTDGLISGVRVFENTNAFEKNTLYSGGELKDHNVVLVEFGDGKCYITARGEIARDDLLDFIYTSIINRAGSVRQLKDELDGYDLGLGYRTTNVTLYQDEDGEAANAGDDSGERIIHNGDIVASDDTLKKNGIIRLEFDDGVSWLCLSLGE